MDPDSNLAQRIQIRVENSDPIPDQAGENGPQKKERKMATFNVDWLSRRLRASPGA